MIPQPIAVYDAWAAYDELSDKVELTEALAMHQFDRMLGLRRLGVRFDYYPMDAFFLTTSSSSPSPANSAASAQAATRNAPC